MSRAPEPLPRTVEIWIEPVARGSDRSVFGWCFAADRNSDTRAIVVVLNIEYPLVRRALAGRDQDLIALMLGLCLADYLLHRSGHCKWMQATLIEVLASLFPDQPAVRKI